jgi:hypothetical protein
VSRRRRILSFGRVPAAPCPHCGVWLRSATGIGDVGPIVPEPGSVTVCDTCVGWCVFTEGLGLRAATAAEIADIPADKREFAERVAREFGPDITH